MSLIQCAFGKSRMIMMEGVGWGIAGVVGVLGGVELWLDIFFVCNVIF